MRFTAALLICSLSSSMGFTPSPSLRPVSRLRGLLLATMAEGENTAGQGFGNFQADQQQAAEGRGRAALEKMRAENAIANPPPPVVENETLAELPEGSPSPVLGLAGFLILVGVGALFVGGPLWESTGMSPEDSMTTADAAPAFGFVPKGGPTAE